MGDSLVRDLENFLFAIQLSRLTPDELQQLTEIVAEHTGIQLEVCHNQSGIERDGA